MRPTLPWLQIVDIAMLLEKKCLSMLSEGRGRPMAKGEYRPRAVSRHFCCTQVHMWVMTKYRFYK
jgi:hypothetical protein